MRVLAIAGLVLVLVLALAGCGGSSTKRLTAIQARACTVRLFFRTTATQAQEQSVAAKLRSDARVQSLTFTSKAQALAQMKKQNPGLFKSNPPLSQSILPDSYTVVPDQLSDLAGLAHSVTAARWPGVQTVTWGSILHSLCGGGSS